MNIPIIYEDESLFVIDKPAGLVVNRAESVKGETLQDWIENYLSFPRPPASAMLKALRAVKRESIKEKTGSPIRSGMTDDMEDFIRRSGIVHRLDKDTSGLLLIAKTPEAFLDLQLQFKKRKITKKYSALVHGKVIPPEGEIKASVGRLPWNRERFGVLPGGREAQTSYKLSDLYKSSDGEMFSLLELTPHTGRTHQIRIHLKYLGFPIVSDNFYAGRKTYQKDIIFCPRLFLHAAKIGFYNLHLNKFMEFESSLPKDLSKVIAGLVRQVIPS